MKKLLIVSSILLASSFGYCVPNQPQNIGSVKTDVLVIPSVTLAQMNVLTPDATGQIIYVSDALQSRVCISTGAAGGSVIGAWVVAAATGTFAGISTPHCN
jgi:hypothetical protein